MFIKFRQKLNKKGFTLIELLIVVAIIGILAAIAIPQFSLYRIRGYNAAAHSDAKNIATGEEAFFVDNQQYLNTALISGPGSIIGDTAPYVGTALPGAKLSNNVKAKIVASTTGGTFYTIGAAHTQGDKIFAIESDEGKWKYQTKVAGVAMATGDISAATTVVDYAWTPM